MGLVLKYVERTKAGSWLYRRRVPKEVSGVILKREFKKKLGDTEREALKAWPGVHAAVEREIAAAQRRLTPEEQATSSDRDAYEAALKQRAALIADGVAEEELVHEGDMLADSFPQNDWSPVGVSPLDRHKVNLLRLGPERYRPPPPKFTDAHRLYIKEHMGGDALHSADSREVSRVGRIVRQALEALGRDPLLTSLTREDARKVRDCMLGREKSTGARVATQTVRRELNVLRAVVNFGAKEFDLPATFQNPFNGLPLGAAAREGQVSDAERRDPIPPDIRREIDRRLQDRAKLPLFLIWRLLENTGCRLAEVTGLRVEDVDISSDLPHIRLVPHEGRRLKNDASQRSVPLVGGALIAAKEALKLPRGDTGLLFSRYGRPRGSDAASAALMRHVRRVTSDPLITVHSLRHTMKDRLLVAGVSSQIQDMILGHARQGVGDRTYGGARAKLEVATDALKKALCVVPSGEP